MLYFWLDPFDRRHDPGFAAAWDQVWRGTIRRHLPGVVAAMIHKAQEGDVQAARLVADLAGVLKGQETNVQVNVDIGGIDLEAARKSILGRLDRAAAAERAVAGAGQGDGDG